MSKGLSTSGKIRKAIEHDNDSQNIFKERNSLTIQLKEIDLRLPLLSKDNLNREFLKKDKARIIARLQILNKSLKGKGGTVNDHFRSVVLESFPKDLASRILEEANNRIRGHEPKRIDILILSDKHQEELESIKTLKSQVSNLKTKLDKIRDQLNIQMPDIAKISDNHEYLQAIKLQKILTKLLKLL